MSNKKKKVSPCSIYLYILYALPGATVITPSSTYCQLYCTLILRKCSHLPRGPSAIQSLKKAFHEATKSWRGRRGVETLWLGRAKVLPQLEKSGEIKSLWTFLTMQLSHVMMSAFFHRPKINLRAALEWLWRFSRNSSNENRSTIRRVLAVLNVNLFPFFEKRTYAELNYT